MTPAAGGYLREVGDSSSLWHLYFMSNMSMGRWDEENRHLLTEMWFWTFPLKDSVDFQKQDGV